MAKERCVKKSFQESLEVIKERMKEKRTKNMAKVATVNKALATKVKIISNNCATSKSLQANNIALALALEAEKYKSRQAQDFILQLKREHQNLMFEIFFLRRKLNILKGDGSSESPASTPASAVVKSATTTPLLVPEPLAQMCEPASDVQRNYSHVSERRSRPDRRCRQEEFSEKMTPGNQKSKGKFSLSQPKSDLEKTDLETDNSFLKNVSIRRRISSLNVCIEESPMVKSVEVEQNFISKCDVSAEEIILPAEECCNDEVMATFPYQSSSKEEFLLLTNHSKMSSSTPEPKPKQSQSLKGKTESRTGREKVIKGKVERHDSVPLKKPWEKAKPRARSKSRDRGASKQIVSKEKMNLSLNTGDAYDFVCEESKHVMPFRQTKLDSPPPENKHPDNDQSVKSSSSSDELNDSLYVPTKAKAKNRNVEQNAGLLPLRPRSKRNKLQQPSAVKTENKGSEQVKQDVAKRKTKARSSTKGSVETDVKPADDSTERRQMDALPKCRRKTAENAKLSIDVRPAQENAVHSTDWNMCELEGASVTPRFSLSDVTNLSTSSGSTDLKKHSFPFSDDRKISAGGMRKRRCTVTVSYAEPSLHKKLRRGDPFTDTEFLHSPIFKNSDSKRKSMNRKSLARYNEAFVGCR